jgi:cobalt-zinc-cadmium efflux system membrane fusion protein
MRVLLFSLLLISPLLAGAQDMQIKITPEQIDKLDIKVGALAPSRQVPLLYAPAKVVVPANHELVISSTQPGLVVQLLANIGDNVKKGQVLAIINSPELVTLQREFLTAGNALSLSELEYNRDKKLLQEGVIADRRWQESQNRFSSQSAQSDTSRQLLSMAGMTQSEINSLAQNRKLNSLLHIYAPISGVVLERSTTVGSRLDIQAPLYRIADLSELWLEINIPQEQMNALHVGDQVQVEDTPITAKISLLGQSVNHETQTVIARAIIDGKQSLLRAGQNVYVQIMQTSQQTDFKVPNSAISQHEGHNYIFVRNNAGFAVTKVNIIGKQNNESVINAPLSGREQIAIKGSGVLKANWLGLGAGE